jgi:hypothetical protein
VKCRKRTSKTRLVHQGLGYGVTGGSDLRVSRRLPRMGQEFVGKFAGALRVTARHSAKPVTL